MKHIPALLIGMVFGLGIALSGMANPAKVQNFFDLAGIWDPSLIFVMGGALLVAAIGYRLVFRAAKRPLLDADFHLLVSHVIDRQLIGGAAVFGIGWGIAGFCPGGAIPALGLGHSETLVFLAAMIAGIVAARLLRTRLFSEARAAI
jgi:uncharacterized protein